ncbi:MAG: carboxymuconolactone decarboxylase family protein [Alphaproteobacteria bacterium]|nr:carboxymuconolactone decarboxylase family protein [Alphaproteobacteria bacterium]
MADGKSREHVQELMYSSLLNQYGPRTVAGYQRLRKVVDEDGALPAWFKSLAVACAAASKGFADMVRFQVRTGHVRGLTLEQGMGGVITMTSARGAGAAQLLLEAVADVFGVADSHLDKPAAAIVADGEAEANFRAYMGGNLHPNFAALLEASQDLADAYYLLRTGTLDHNRLESKLAELLLVAVLAADYQPLVSVHIGGAKRAGATDAEIVEAIACAFPVSGLAGLIAGVSALVESRG